MLRVGATPCPVECKASVAVNKTHTAGVENYLRQYGLRVGTVVRLAPFGRIDRSDGITVINVPLYSAAHLHAIVKAI